MVFEIGFSLAVVSQSSFVISFIVTLERVIFWRGQNEVINELECIEDYCKKAVTQLHLIQ